MKTTILPLCALLLTTMAFADYEYRYVEGETFNRAETEGLRDEGFTSWMAHPSGGKVVVMGRPAGGFLEYDVKGLAAGDYYLYVRCLALSITNTKLLWDGKELGLVRHALYTTSLRWSLPVKVSGGGDHVLRLQGGDDATQWPYIDTILLTNQPGYVPSTKDADFVSLQTAWPLLLLPGKEPLTLAPLPPATPQLLPELRLEKLSMETPVLGTNSVQVSVTSPTAKEITLTAGFAAGELGAPTVQAAVSLQPGVPQTVTLKPVALRSGAGTLLVGLRDGQLSSNGSYPVVIPAAATIALDEYAYPTTQQQGQWTATLNCSPELLPQMKLDVTLTALASGKTLWKRSAGAAETVSLPVDIMKMSVGRYEVTAYLMWNGETAQTDRREFIIYKPTPFPAWEPIKTTKAVGDTILVNGKPFLGKLLYHSGGTEQAQVRGFNLVQCWGDMPDPVVQMTQHLDNAQKAGMYGALALFNTPVVNKGSEFDLPNLERVVNALKDHPALWGWDLIDEPEPTMKPEAVQAAADLIRKLDPNHIVWVNLCMNTRIVDYLGSQDLWSFDFYPYPTLTPFAYKRQWIDGSDEKLLGKKPLGTVLQTFNYNRHEQRMPSPDELRTAAWLHIIHGYKWFGYYSYYDGEPAGGLGNTPVLWSYCRALNTELVQLEDLILAPGQWQPVKLDPQTDKLEAREKKLGDKWYVVVVSDSKEPLTMKLTPTLAKGKRQLLIESAAPAVAGTTIETTVRPFATQVWELSQ